MVYFKKYIFSKKLSLFTFKILEENLHSSLFVELLLCVSFSTAVVERGFSSLRRIMTDWRSHLNEASIRSLMHFSVRKHVWPKNRTESDSSRTPQVVSLMARMWKGSQVVAPDLAFVASMVC